MNDKKIEYLDAIITEIPKTANLFIKKFFELIFLGEIKDDYDNGELVASLQTQKTEIAGQDGSDEIIFKKINGEEIDTLISQYKKLWTFLGEPYLKVCKLKNEAKKISSKIWETITIITEVCKEIVVGNNGGSNGGSNGGGKRTKRKGGGKRNHIQSKKKYIRKKFKTRKNNRNRRTRKSKITS